MNQSTLARIVAFESNFFFCETSKDFLYPEIILPKTAWRIAKTCFKEMPVLSYNMAYQEFIKLDSANLDQQSQAFQSN